MIKVYIKKHVKNNKFNMSFYIEKMSLKQNKKM